MSLAVRHETVGVSGAPHRLRIAHLSDLHLWFTTRRLRLIEARLAAWRPDVLALTGDYADTPWGREMAVGWFRRMAAEYPLCWIAGNHDHWRGRRFLQQLEALHAAHPIDRRDAWVGRYRFTSWARMRDGDVTGEAAAPTVVLLHDPAGIEPTQLRGATNRVLLAGHLHGGQITLWRDHAGRPQPATSCYRWLADRSQIGAVPLIVSRGLGETLPVRIGAPREIVMVDFWS
jgi:predicted MPP superfamily phosphohydrolase